MVVTGVWHPVAEPPADGLGSAPMAFAPIMGPLIGTAHTAGGDTATPVIVHVQGPDGWLRVTLSERRSDPVTVHPSAWPRATTGPDSPSALANRFTVASVTGVGTRRQTWAVPSRAARPAAAR